MFIELHIIQNFPPSNLNRDDVGQPKDAWFGGARRARISSQCLKRAIRYAGKDPQDKEARSLFEQYTQVPLARRTHLIVSALQKRMADAGKTEEDAAKVALEFARMYSSKKGKMNARKPEETTVLLYMSEQEIDDIADRLLKLDWERLLPAIESARAKQSSRGDRGEKEEDADKAAEKSPLGKLAGAWSEETKGRSGAPDIALFGRMLADNPKTNIDAACQVAHAISTHAVSREMDYFTAVDDLQPREQAGAGFLDVAYFNSACFYRYARVDYQQLKENLGGDADLAIRTVEAFLRASEAAIPGGKKSSFAQECRPSFMLAVLRGENSFGWSLVNAFEKPVRADAEHGLVEISVRELCNEFEDHCERYGVGTIAATSVLATRRLTLAGVISERLVPAIAKPASEGESAFDAFVAAIIDPLRKKESAA